MMILMDKEQVASTLQISVRQVNVLVQRRQLPAGVRWGKKVMWVSDVVNQYLADQFATQLSFKKSETPAEFVQMFD